MAKRKRSSRRSHSKTHRAKAKATIPLAVAAGVIGSVARPAKTLMDNPANIELAMNQLIEGYTGYYPADGSFDPGRLKYGLAPLIAGFAAHKVAGMVGVNKALGSAKVPWVRI